MVVGYPDTPAVGRRRAADRHVATERDESATSGGFRDHARRAVGGKRLRGRTEVELDTGRHKHETARSIEADLLPEPVRTRLRCECPTGARSNEAKVRS